jgi:hypothetical protein
MGSKGKPKFRVGQVVRCEGHYFRLSRHQYSPDRIASWDNGHWYWEGNSQYCEHALRALSAREAGPARGKRSTK